MSDLYDFWTVDELISEVKSLKAEAKSREARIDCLLELIDDLEQDDVPE